MMMQPIQQQKQLPRFSKDFIGISHHLAEKKKERRRAQQQERIIANRILFIQNEQFRAQHSLYKKKMELSNILRKSQRQSNERQARQKLLLERQKEIEIAREQNRLKKLLHRQSLDYNTHLISQRNNIDYKIAKSKLQEGEERKKLEMREGLSVRQDRYVTLNIKKQQGRSRIDKFFKDKNKEHTKLYKQKINSIETATRQKFNTIQKLSQLEEVLRKKLEQSSMKVSQMDNLIGSVSSRVRRSSLSRTSLVNSPQQHDPQQITTMQEDILLKQLDSSSSKKLFGSEAGKLSRKRTRHRNKFSQYITS